MNPLEQPSQQFEVKSVAKIVESRETDELISCLENLELKAKSIGEGQNAIVFVAEGTPFEKVCLKKAKEKPTILCNTIEEEHQYQMLARTAGVKTPLTLLSLDTDKGAFFIMERINGVTVDEAARRPQSVPEGFEYHAFCEALEKEVEKMHNAGIYHRDLHTQNVMIDTEGNPVIIDFGTATRGTGSDLTYEQTVMRYDPLKGRYDTFGSYFKDDDDQVRKIKRELYQYIKGVPRD